MSGKVAILQYKDEMAASTTITTTVPVAAAEAEMENSEVNKTSDEIINELFSSLNVPLSPKIVEVEERIIIKGEQVSAHTGDSDNSGDDESDSKSSESEGEPKATVGEMQANKTEKMKQKKKKDKRKKKKKHRKKEDGGRHKHRKKKKKESFETAEEAKLAGDILPDVKLKNQALIQKIMIREEIPPATVDGREKRKSRSKSPKLLHREVEVIGGNNRKKLRESQSPHKEVKASPWEGIIDLSPEVCKDTSCVPVDGSEGVSKSEIQSCPTHEKSPGLESGSKSTQISPTVLSEHKRKQSPHSCSPSPGKKMKPCSSVSPSKSSSPKPVSRPRSPTARERSRSRSVKGSKLQSRGTKSRSPAVKRSRSQSRKRSESKKRSGSRKRSTSKSRKKSESKLKKRSRSRSRRRSRSRSKKRSRSRSRRSRSRSRRRSRSRSRRRARSRSKKRSRSRSKKRSRSRSKSRRRSRSKSSKRSGSKSRRKSVSKSKRSKSRDRSRSRSRRRSSSKSEKRSRSRLRKRSRSKSSKRSSSKSRRSRSRRKSRSQSHRRSRSKSSHKCSPAKERFDMFAVMRERANRLAELKNQGIPDGSLGSLLLSAAASVQPGGGTDVPPPVPTADPSSIPLPEKEVLLDDSPAKDEPIEDSSVGVEDKPVPVIEDNVISSPQEQDSIKSKDGSKNKQEEGNEKGKMKTIITIKSLKDSVVFQQAQEEAERKAKEKVDQPAGSKNSSEADSEEKHNQESTETEQQDEAKQGGEEDDRGESEEENEERKQDEEKQEDESPIREVNVENEDEITKKQIEKGTRETEGNTLTKQIQEIDIEEINIETKTSSRKRTVSKTEEREESKESKESKHSSKIEKEEKNRSKQASKDEENDGNDLVSESEKRSSRREEKEGKKMKLSSKTDKAKEKLGNMHIDKVEEEENKEDKHSNKAEEKEKEDIDNSLCTKEEEEEEGENEQSSKAEENEEEKLSTPSNKTEEDKSKGSKSSSKVGEKEEGKKSKHSSKTEDKEDSKGGKDVTSKNGHPQLEDDSDDKIEEGEITSDKEEIVTKPSTKTHSKKSKKDKSSSKEKKRSHKDKTKNKEEKKKAHDKKKEQEKARSKDTHKSRQHSSSGSKEHSHSRRHRKHSRSRSRSRDHSSRQHRRSHSRSRSKSRSKRRRESTSDLRDKVTRKRLLEIARRNAVYLMENGCLPPSVEKEQLVKIKAGGKSVDELTDFCKQLVASGNYSDVDVSDPSMSSEEENSTEKPFSSTRHPFSVRDSKPILMNIRNAPMLPTKTNAERLAGQAKLREQFPVSSGSQHRTKESEWVPVTPKEKKEEDKVFTKPEPPSVDISEIVSTRLSAMRKLQDNPNDSEAIKTLNNVQKEMQNWALSKQEPGQFTGTTGVKVLSQEELSSGHQAWARKEQFKEAAPVRPHFGLKMLQKMGWSPGEGLGKNKEGTTEPLLLDVKMDKKGFHAQEEVTPKKQPIPLVKDLSGKHPVSALVELCSKRKWSPPDFEMVFDCGPDHKKNFLMKVMVNGQEFKPSVAASTKKMAKANAAAAYLQSLGLYPKDPRYPL